MNDDFFKKGFYFFQNEEGKKYADKITEVVDFSEIKWHHESYNDEPHVPMDGDSIYRMNFDLEPTTKKILEITLMEIHLDIAKKYVEPYFKNYSLYTRSLWEGVHGKEVTEWHNDKYRGTNLFFILYLSDLEKYKTGLVHFTDGKNEWSEFPNYGKFVMINCEKLNFLHRADDCEYERILSTFSFNADFSQYY